MSQLLEAALEYADKGWPIFPCRKNKQPYTDSGVLEATTNRKRIREWWERWPMANIGLDVGGAGMVAVDIDPGADYDELEEAIESLDTGLASATPRGGEHLFFRLDDGETVPPSQGKLAQHVDVRSFHSYVLLPPSSTRDGAYVWDDYGRPARRSESLLRNAMRNMREKHEDRDEWLIEPDLPENLDLAIEWLRNDAQIAIEGHNGDHMAYATAGMMKSYGLSPETALELMWEHWSPRCDPPWTEGDLEHLERKIDNAYAYNTSPPGNVTPAYRIARQQSLFKPVSRDTTSGGREVSAGRFRIVDERAVDEITDPEWLVDGAIPVGGYAMLVGPPGVGKSFVALDLCLSIASGGASWYDSADDWLGMWERVRRGPVLFAAGEGRAGTKSRVRAWSSFHLEGERTSNFYLADPVPHPTEEDTTAFIEAILQMCPDGVELVVIDTVARSMQGLNENAQQDVSQFTLLVQTLQQELGCAVLALHHTGHENKSRARGGSGFYADVDCEFVLEPLSKTGKRQRLLMRNTKQKDAPEWEHPKVVELLSYEDSLVARAVDESEQAKAVEETAKAERAKHTAGGRKKKEDMAEEIATLRKAAYQILKKYPAREFSKSAFAEAIAADERISVAAGTIRNKYIEQFTVDKTHPIAGCFDAGTRRWIYRPKI